MKRSSAVVDPSSSSRARSSLPRAARVQRARTGVVRRTRAGGVGLGLGGRQGVDDAEQEPRRPPATAGLSEINTENVKNLKAAWTFSTGVLRGHEGEPIVVGTTMYLATPFPNIVYALDLTQGRRAGQVEVRAEAGRRR